MLILRESATEEILYSVTLSFDETEPYDDSENPASLSDLVSDAKSNNFENFSKLLSSKIKDNFNINTKVSFWEETDDEYIFSIVSPAELDETKLLNLIESLVKDFDFGYDVGDKFDVGPEIPSSSWYDPPEYESEYVSASSDVYIDDVKVNREP